MKGLFARYVQRLTCLALASGTLSLAIAAQPVAEVRVDFTSQAITGTYVRGLAHQGTQRPIRAEDPVRIASISKLVMTLGLMRLVEQGTLDLDRDVSAYLGWPLRHPNYPEIPVSLKLLLSHQSGLTDEAGYVADTQTRIRDQVERRDAWDPAHPPGTYFRYTNLNFPVIASIMERVTGERFDRLMQRLVFAPLDIDACFNWTTCSDRAVARAVTIYRSNGEVGVDDWPGNRSPCPVLVAPGDDCSLTQWRAGENGGLFSPQGGLRISARDLAKIGQLLLNQGSWKGVTLLHPSSVATIFEPQWVFDGANGLTYESDLGDNVGAFFCRYGLASQSLSTSDPRCADDPIGDGRSWVGHGGDAYGLVSGLWLDREKGLGIAYFITGGDLTELGQQSAFYAVEERLLARPLNGADRDAQR
ncbi:MAG: serine hydrolase domain-containing protein [Steroidobacteraceae bacterium]|jgi:CubicO group peptidase (beta-lactamase class C family)